MTRVLVVDDEPLAVDRLVRLCHQLAGIQVVGTAAEGGEALQLVASLAPDLLLLDITMPGLDGFAVARAAQCGGSSAPAVVFVTAHDRFAIEAFEVEAVDYLLKPVAPDRLARAIARAVLRPRAVPGSGSGYWWIPQENGVVRLDLRAVDLLVAERDYVRVEHGGRSSLIRDTLSRVEERLDPRLFMRVHRSFIVRFDRVQAIRRMPRDWRAELVDGRSIPLGRTYLPLIRARLHAPHRGRTNGSSSK